MATATTAARSSLVDFLAPRDTDSAARRHLIAAVIFLLVAGFFTMLLFVKLAYPNFLGGQAFTTYGRLRPIAISATVLGFVTLMHMAAIYYLVPRLTGARLWNERLANLGLWLAVGVNVAAIVALAAGYSDGREWLEIPWWLDIAVVCHAAGAGCRCGSHHEGPHRRRTVRIAVVLPGRPLLGGRALCGRQHPESVRSGLTDPVVVLRVRE